MPPRLIPVLTLLWVMAGVAAFTALAALFGYDEVLREPPGIVLDRFAEAGTPLIAAWALFAAVAFAFAPLAAALERREGLGPHWTGRATALAQGAGLARWVFAVPFLAAAHGLPGQETSAEVTFGALHHLLGVGLGEFAGQLLLMVWTARLAWRIAATPGPRRWLGLAGLATLPLWALGLSEAVAAILPAMVPIKVAAAAFMAWEAWLVALALWPPPCSAQHPAR
jgi:hypothetical protein